MKTYNMQRAWLNHAHARYKVGLFHGFIIGVFVGVLTALVALA